MILFKKQNMKTSSEISVDFTESFQRKHAGRSPEYTSYHGPQLLFLLFTYLIHRPLALYSVTINRYMAMAFIIQSNNGGMTMALCSRELQSTPTCGPHYTTSRPDLRLLASYRNVDRFRRTPRCVESIVFKND
jgi:hypothetical protein